MRTRIATSADLAAIHNLLAHASRQQMHIGGEDIEPAIEWGRFLLLVHSRLDNGANAAEELLACLVTAVDVDSAPPSASQPVRSYVRGVAFARQTSPTTALQQLLHAFAQLAARTQPQPQQLIAYSSKKWLDRALHDAGMTLAERVDYFALERLQKRSWHAAASVSCIIRDTTHTDLNPLVALDSRAFDALWRYAWRQMWDAWLNGPMLTAWVDGELAGYVALTVDAEVCTIARLAVDPAWQGRGLGRALMTASLQLAQEAGCTRVILNTQATNQRAQKLYRAFGFRQTGESFAVFVLDLPVNSV